MAHGPYARLRGESFRFVIGGGLNTLLTYVYYWLLLDLIGYAAAYTVSYAAGIVSGFTINTLFVFRSPWSWRKLMAFPLVHLANYGLGLAVMSLTIRLLGLDERLAPIVATIIVLPFNFVFTRLLLRHRSPAGPQ